MSLKLINCFYTIRTIINNLYDKSSNLSLTFSVHGICFKSLIPTLTAIPG